MRPLGIRTAWRRHPRGVPDANFDVRRMSCSGWNAAERVGNAYRMSSAMAIDALDGMDLKVGDAIRILANAVNVLPVKS